jgi:EAL domain-containing protein (putative c-di-GMP-specific phosphodiesterase class I)
VNLSPRQLLAGNLLPAVAQTLAESGLPPGLLNLEITETVIMESPAAAQAVLGQLKRLGVGLSLDDFGTGYSSLSSFSDFPVDALKVDRSFISRLGTDPKSTEIVKAIIGLTRRLGKMVVAEGVETVEQADRLQKWGCTFAQGYLFHRPLDADGATRLVRELERDPGREGSEDLDRTG